MSSFAILILGIGNALLTDDGAGIHATRLIAESPNRPANVHCQDGGTLGFLLADRIESSTGLIVVDAAELQAPCGTVRVFEDEDMDRFLNTHPNRSVHETGLADLMTMALLSGQLPNRRALIAVQPESADWGTQLSPSVEASLPAVCNKAWELIAGWRA